MAPLKTLATFALVGVASGFAPVTPSVTKITFPRYGKYSVRDGLSLLLLHYHTDLRCMLRSKDTQFFCTTSVYMPLRKSVSIGNRKIPVVRENGQHCDKVNTFSKHLSLFHFIKRIRLHQIVSQSFLTLFGFSSFFHQQYDCVAEHRL